LPIIVPASPWKWRAVRVSLSIFISIIYSITFVTADETYTNPVLVETYNIGTANTGEKHFNQFSGVMGIGDPTVIFHKDKYYLYPTGDNQGYDVYTSSNLVNWEKGPRVFRTEERGAWAPDVFYDDSSKKFYLYYTVNRRIGVAVSDSPDGTFTYYGPLINGAIDAHMFQDDNGKYYLYYTRFPEFIIYVQPMASPTQKQGKPVKLIYPTDEWEKKHTSLTEAPWMLKHNGVYYLLYSASGANTMEYAIGYATADSPLGPFTKYTGNPIIKKGNGIFGPGHASVTKDLNGKLWMVYHQQKGSTIGWNRLICIDPIWFDDKGVLHGKATRGTPQPSPVTEVTISGYSR
jgi:xylan 1,4-beta-xylosidase